MSTVYMLWHHYPDDPTDDNAKLLGVYSSAELAQERIDRKYKDLPGFCHGTGEFAIDPYVIDKDHWQQGFSHMVNIHVPVRNDPRTAWRCVVSEWLPGDRYQVVSSGDQEDEERWEFKPGQIVTCAEREIDGIQRCLAAVTLADHAMP